MNRTLPEGTLTLNTYVIYNEASDIDTFVTEDIKEVLEEAGDLIDDGVDHGYTVLVYNNLSNSEYFSNHRGEFKPYSIAEFVKNFSPFSINSEEVIDKGVVSSEVYHNLSEDEQIEVLHFISDKMLIDELHRRFNEYRTATDSVTEALDKMKIFK